MMERDENVKSDEESRRYNVYRVWSWFLAVMSIASFAFSEETDLILPAFGVLTQVWSGALTCIAGLSYYKDEFPMFRPFRGGTMFVMMQSIAWTLFSFAAAFGFLLLANSPMPRVETMGNAVLGFSANSILNLSLDKLIVRKTQDSPKSRSPRGRKRSSSAGSIAKQIAEESPKQILRVFPYGLLCGVLCFVCCVFMDIYRSSTLSEYCVYVTAVLCVVGAFATHILSADLESFMPFSGGFEFRLLQAIGWLAVGSVAYCALSVAPEISSHRGALTIYGLTGLISNVLILWSFEFYVVLMSEHDDDGGEKNHDDDDEIMSKEEKSNSRSPRRRRRHRRRRHSPRRNVVSSCLRDAKRGLTLQIAMSSCVIWTLQIVAILIGIFWADDGVIRTDGALLRMPWFCQIIIIAAPLAAHVILGGIFRRSDGYKVYQPFRGGEIHVLLQSFGWLFFSAVVLFVVQSVIQERREGYWLVPFAITSHVLITISVLQFQRPRILIKRSDSFVRSRPKKRYTIEQYVFTFDMIVAVSMISLFIVELLNLIQEDDEDGLVRSFILLLLKVPILCLPLAMFGLYVVAFKGSVKNFTKLWRPFAGPEFFVMCEAIAWTIFVPSFVGNILILAAHRRQDRRSSLSYIVGWCVVVAVGFVFAYLTMRYAAKSLLQSATKMSRRSRNRSLSVSVSADRKRKISKYVSVVVAHVSLLLFVFVDVRVSYAFENHNTTRSIYFLAVLSAVLGCIFVHVQGVTYLRNFEAVQPFRGGSDFVVLQAIGWMLFGVGSALALVFGNLGVVTVRLPGLTFFLGLAFYASQLTLLHSLDSFHHLSALSYTLDDRVGVLLGSLSAILFLFVDLVVIRFGLPVYMFRVVTAIAWIAAGASVPLSTLILYKSSKSEKKNRNDALQPVYYGSFRLFLTHNVRSPIIVIMATALWSFSILLGSILVLSSVLHAEYLPKAWTASLAALTHIVSHITLRSGSSSTSSSSSAIISLIPFAIITSTFIWIAVKVFSNIVLPCLRIFLDNPMHLYATYSRQRKGWISPDGIQAMWNVRLESKLRYGPTEEFSVDILSPISPSKCFVSDSKSVRSTPVIYAHGGAHMCVRRSILHHSMTPLARCGLTVYSVEYPLSPEAKYPVAVLAVLHAILYVSRFHCTNVKCVGGTMGKHHHGIFPALDASRRQYCKHCGEKLGTNVVNLCGDSAGGSLVSMATAALNNPHLLEEMLSLIDVNSGSHGVESIRNVNISEFPKIERLGILYGLLDRNQAKPEDNSFRSFLYALICRMGIGLVFNLYDNKSSSKTKTSSSQNRTSLMDLKDTDLKRFCKSTVMICGLSDPLLFGNRNANKRLKKLGHDSELLILPGSHGFHGFPPLWMHYLGSNWRQNALPATIRLAKHFTNDLFQENLMLKMQSMETSLNDWTPLLVFPFFLLILPIIVVCCILYTIT